MDTTGKALVEHWNWAAEKGGMNKHTAAGLRAACTQVLGALDNWESVDITSLDGAIPEPQESEVQAGSAQYVQASIPPGCDVVSPVPRRSGWLEATNDGSGSRIREG